MMFKLMRYNGNMSTLNLLKEHNLGFINLVKKRKFNYKNGVYGYKAKENKLVELNDKIMETRWNQSNFYRLVMAYRNHGHKYSHINPVATEDVNTEEAQLLLNLQNFGLNLEDKVLFEGILNHIKIDGTVEEAVKFLHDAYCKFISAEFNHLESHEEIEWFTRRFESLQNELIPDDYKKELLFEMLKAQSLDKFLAIKFVSLKKYGGEGAESMMGFFMELFKILSRDGVKSVIIGSHHRGRMNLLTGLLNMDPSIIFRKVLGKSELDNKEFLGDVLSHLSPKADIIIDGSTLNVITTNLPSHLEAVCPVSVGKARGLQQIKKEAQYGNSEGEWGDSVVNIQVHGDGSIMGQGVSQESIIMSTLPHFNTGGTIHLIINNQLGFTTTSAHGRGTRYASDIAKVISAPVIHVNGDHPEEVVKAARIAIEYQRKYRKNVFIDLNCYRRWGHNELDDPTFTNPLIYKIIHAKMTIPNSYAEKLVQMNLVTETEIKEKESNYANHLNDCLKSIDQFTPPKNYLIDEWDGYGTAPAEISTWNTGVDKNLLKYISYRSVYYPSDFNIHSHLTKSHIEPRLRKMNEEMNIDWATAEALAIGSLLCQDYNVRLSGQDVGRGTFCHRHAMLVDQNNENIYIPLNFIHDNQTAFLEVANSMLSEEAVLGFEYGFSTMTPKTLTIWEAQFGDFFNGAQIQIDTYVSSGEAKWISMSGLVLLLPHGYDGAGPEHSSCRIERFLQLSNSSETKPDSENINIQICNPTTPAQYFHLLRRQMIRNYRKPLILVAPKILLRSSEAVSHLNEMGFNTYFHRVLGDPTVTEPIKITKLIFVSGKHYYDLQNYKKQINAHDTAIIRLEELCPFPTHDLLQEISKYKNARTFIWSQEEPRNMGAWSYCKLRFENLTGRKITYSGRDVLAAPAVGIGELHKKSVEMVIQNPFSMKNK